MLLTIIIFVVAVMTAFGMLLVRAWEIRTSQVEISNSMNTENKLPDMSFRRVEKNVLYFTKHIIQNAILVIVKQWFIVTTKMKKRVAESWPKIDSYFQSKSKIPETPKKPSFFKKAIIESGAKIKRVREKVKKDHEEKTPQDVEMNNDTNI